MENRAEIKEIIKNLQDAARSSDAGKLSESFIAYDECRKASRSASLYQFGINPTKEAVTAITSLASYEKAILTQAKEYIKYIKDFRQKGTHKERKEVIESALRLLDLIKNQREKTPATTSIRIAEAYLWRSRIIRPKGRTIPEKKKKCLSIGIQFIENISSRTSATLEPSEREELYRVQGLLHIELNKIYKKERNEQELRKILKDALDNGCTKFSENNGDVQIAVRYSEIEESEKQYLPKIINSSKANDLEKAKAFYLLDDTSNFKNYLYKAIRVLRKVPFSHPQWKEMVDFLKTSVYGIMC